MIKTLILICIITECHCVDEYLCAVEGYHNYCYIVTIDSTKVEKVELAKVEFDILIVPQITKYEYGAFEITFESKTKDVTKKVTMKGSVIFNSDGTISVNGNIGHKLTKGIVIRMK